MTQFPSPEAPRVLAIGTGNVKERFLSLVSGCEVESLTLVEALDEIERDYWAIVVVVAERPVPAVEARMSEACWRSGTPLTSGLLVAQQFRIGPTVIPGRTPCYECWSRRVRSRAPDLPVHDAIQRHGQHDVMTPWFRGSLSALDEQVAALLAAEVVSLATGNYSMPPDGLGRYWEGNAVYGHLRAHLFAGVGTCARCVSAELGRGGALALKSYVTKHFPTSRGASLEP
jgi:bacteriocin biosynthesis cyclodehydratase domain-containing protein